MYYDVSEQFILLEACKLFIYHHLEQKITLSGLSSVFGVSPQYLSALFKKQENLSPMSFITKEKIHMSENLLRYSTYSIEEIAVYLGFSSSSHFIRTFRKINGISPAKFRRLHFHPAFRTN